ncbi:hypothetical protein BASA81_003517 [Batrachochytrium salamandrivorans]|nr:hypothetical protein BASA81_003517 [Batrachochytrium salamandrivorans]
MTPWFLHCCCCCRRGGGEGASPAALSGDDDGLPPLPPFKSAGFARVFGIYQPRCGGACLVPTCGRHNKLWVTFLLLFLPCTYFVVFVAPKLSWLGPGVVLHCESTQGGEGEGDFLNRNASAQQQRVTVAVVDGAVFELVKLRAVKSKWTLTVIEQYDHYCPYLGNAVGKRNYRYYLLFLTLCFATCTNNLGWMVALFVASARDTESGDLALQIVFAVYSLGMAGTMSFLLAHHWRLACLGLTTMEASSKQQHQPRPGACRNLFKLFCSEHYSSRVAGVQQQLEGELEEGLLLRESFSLFSPPSSPLSVHGLIPREDSEEDEECL